MPRSRVPQAQEPNQAGFLDLASEIRNEIYHMWAEDVLHVYVRAKGKAYTTAAHPATNVSHMVHREFTGVLAQTAVENAQKVNVGIEDFDFSPAIAFLNRVIAHPIAHLSDFEGPHPDDTNMYTRDLTLTFSFTKSFWKTDPPVDRISRWLRYSRNTIPNVFYNIRISDIADHASVKDAIESLCSGSDPAKIWVYLRLALRDWEERREDETEEDPAWMRESREQQGIRTEPKTAEELAVDAYYDDIFAEMDAKQNAEWHGEVKEEPEEE